MKKFLFLALVGILLSPVARAEGEDDKGERFETNKSKILAELDERIAKIQQHRGCVAAAKDRDGLKACRETMKEWREDRKEERGERRKMREERRKN